MGKNQTWQDPLERSIAPMQAAILETFPSILGRGSVQAVFLEPAHSRVESVSPLGKEVGDCHVPMRSDLHGFRDWGGAIAVISPSLFSGFLLPP